MSENGRRQLLNAQEVAQLLGVSSFTVRRLISRGDLPHLKIGRLIRVDSADLDAFTEARKIRLRSSIEAEA
jgi:excisionase family DNA binding protein